MPGTLRRFRMEKSVTHAKPAPPAIDRLQAHLGYKRAIFDVTDYLLRVVYTVLRNRKPFQNLQFDWHCCIPD